MASIYGIQLNIGYKLIIILNLYLKMLSIANPSNGQGFFSLLYNYNWVKEKDMVGLTKDKVHSLATTKISADRYLLTKTFHFQRHNIKSPKYSYFKLCVQCLNCRKRDILFKKRMVLGKSLETMSQNERKTCGRTTIRI